MPDFKPGDKVVVTRPQAYEVVRVDEDPCNGQVWVFVRRPGEFGIRLFKPENLALAE